MHPPKVTKRSSPPRHFRLVHRRSAVPGRCPRRTLFLRGRRLILERPAERCTKHAPPFCAVSARNRDWVNGTTLRLVIAFLGLNRLSPRNEVLRDRVLVLAYAEVADSVRDMAQYHALTRGAVEQVIDPY